MDRQIVDAPAGGDSLTISSGSSYANGDGVRELSFADIFSVLRRRLYIVLAPLCIFLGVAIFYLQGATYKYSAQLRVASVETGGGGLSEQLGGLATFAGVDLPGEQGISPIILYVEDLHSYDIAEIIVDRPVLMRKIFDGQWDSDRRQWVQPKSFLRELKNALFGALGLPVYPWQSPSAGAVQKFLERNILIDEGKTKPIIKITFAHVDRAFAASFVTALHQIADERQRRRAISRSTQSIAYLNRQLAVVTNAEHRRALAEQLGEQERLRMNASSNMPFAAEPLGRVVASERPTSPNPIMVLVVSMVAGLLVGAGAAIAVELVRRDKS